MFAFHPLLILNLPLRQRKQWLIYRWTQTASKCLPQSEQLNAAVSLFKDSLCWRILVMNRDGCHVDSQQPGISVAVDFCVTTNNLWDSTRAFYWSQTIRGKAFTEIWNGIHKFSVVLICFLHRVCRWRRIMSLCFSLWPRMDGDSPVCCQLL